MANATFRRYTNLASAIHILQSRTITLLDPCTWDDKNDSHFMSEYKKRSNAASVLALCFADCFETYHHWRVFSHGSDGICIEFDKDRLLFSVEGIEGLRHGSMNYKLLKDARRMEDIAIEALPFLKRTPYVDEAEYRIVYVGKGDTIHSYDIDIDIGWISRITLSPWLHASLAKSVKSSLKSIPGCSRLKIYRSTLIDNPDWKRLPERVLS